MAEVGSRTANCRDCGEPIQFLSNGRGGWIPIRVGGTDRADRHKCQMDVVCTGCQKTFKGAPWMKECPSCYNKGGSPNQRPDPAPATHRPEPLQNDFDDGNDPF